MNDTPQKLNKTEDNTLDSLIEELKNSNDNLQKTFQEKTQVSTELALPLKDENLNSFILENAQSMVLKTLAKIDQFKMAMLDTPEYAESLSTLLEVVNNSVKILSDIQSKREKNITDTKNQLLKMELEREKLELQKQKLQLEFQKLKNKSLDDNDGIPKKEGIFLSREDILKLMKSDEKEKKVQIIKNELEPAIDIR